MRGKLILAYIGILVGVFIPLELHTAVESGINHLAVKHTNSITNVGLTARSGVEAIPRSCSDYYEIVKRYDWNPKIALAIMKAESNCNYADVGDTHAINGLLAPSCGLMQIRTLKGRPSCNELFNADKNIEWAYKLYQRSGWTPWTQYNNGSYKRYLE